MTRLGLARPYSMEELERKPARFVRDLRYADRLLREITHGRPPVDDEPDSPRAAMERELAGLVD